jgi:hypothetical protein
VLCSSGLNGAATFEDYRFGGAFLVPSFSIRSKSHRSGIYWLYLIVVPYLSHCLESSGFLLGENLQSFIGQLCLCIFFLEAALLENLFCSPGCCIGGLCPVAVRD